MSDHLTEEQKWNYRVLSLKSMVKDARDDFEYARSRLHSLTQALIEEEATGPRSTSDSTKETP